MARGIRTTAKKIANGLLLAHSHEYMAAGVPQQQIRVQHIGYESILYVENIPVWKVTVKNESINGGKDMIWVEDEYIGPTFVVASRDNNLAALFLPKQGDAVSYHPASYTPSG